MYLGSVNGQNALFTDAMIHVCSSNNTEIRMFYMYNNGNRDHIMWIFSGDQSILFKNQTLSEKRLSDADYLGTPRDSALVSQMAMFIYVINGWLPKSTTLKFGGSIMGNLRLDMLR